MHYDENGDTEWACGGDDDCDAVEAEPACDAGYDHRWTSEGTGGCEENPGVWALGGTAMSVAARCVLCGCGRMATNYGWQRDPGQCDRVAYETHAYDVDPAEARHERARQRRNTIRRAKRRAAKRALVTTVAPGMT